MCKLFASPIGRLRLLGIIECLSLLLLGMAVPIQHFYGDASLVRAIGPIYELLFLLYLLSTLRIGVEYHWCFADTTWKVLLASLVLSGTFFIERSILASLQR